MPVNMEGFRHLTPRENETLQLLVRGMSNKEIAHELGLAVATIKLHVRNLMLKTGTRNRTHLVVTYLQNNTKAKKKMDPENSIQHREEENSEKIWPEIQDHLNYLNEVYNLCFAVQFAMNGKNVSEFSKVYYAQMIILIRITDFIRCIQLLTIKGYPEQAGTLAASIFELAHTAVHFSYNQNATEKWLSANSISEQIRNIIGLNWEQLVKANVEHFGGGDHKNEYRVYKQLCWLKHSLPKMQVMIREDDGVRFNFGPYSDERSISHSWFSMEHAGRLTEFLLSLLDSPSEISSLIKGHLDKVTQMRNVLHERAKERFGTDNPFEPDVREDD